MTTIGILGAGKLGSVLARLAVAGGYRTLIAGSGNPAAIQLIIDVLAPGATAATAGEVVADADIVILAIPLGRYLSIPRVPLASKVVVDAMNYWPATDGTLAMFEGGVSSSQVVQAHLAGSHVVKALSHLGYHQLGDDARPPGAADRHAIALAGDDEAAVHAVAQLVDRMGFDPVIAGPLETGARFGPGSAAFAVSTSHGDLANILATGALSPGVRGRTQSLA